MLNEKTRLSVREQRKVNPLYAQNIPTAYINTFLVLKLDTLLKLSESTSHDLRAAYDRLPR